MKILELSQKAHAEEIGSEYALFGHGDRHVANGDVLYMHTVKGYGRDMGDAVRGLDRGGEIEGVR
jgi:hypothetical protein